MSGVVDTYEDAWEAKSQFDALTPARRRSIHEHARRGEPHPDPETARVARNWAKSLSDPPWRQDWGPLGVALLGPLQAQPLVNRLLRGSEQSPYNDDGVFLTTVATVGLYAALQVRTRIRGRRILRTTQPRRRL